MASFVPKLDILPVEQQRLWGRLGDTPDQFTLYGGTSLALRLGHRVSVDFDFFGSENFDPAKLKASIPYLAGAEVRQMEPNTLTCDVDGVLVSFFGLPSLKVLKAPDVAEGTAVKIASLLDIAASKVKVIQQRASWKDYADIHAIITDGGVTLDEALAAAVMIYGREFNPLVALKALTYFAEPGLAQVTKQQREDLVAAAQVAGNNILAEAREDLVRGRRRKPERDEGQEQ